MESALPTPPADSDAEDSGDDSVPADPEKWERSDVARCVRWVAKTFSVRAPRKHLLPDTGKALLALTQDNWTQICDGNEQSARIYHAYLRHTHAGAKGAPPPEPLPEHQAASSNAADYTYSRPHSSAFTFPRQWPAAAVHPEVSESSARNAARENSPIGVPVRAPRGYRLVM